MCKHSPIYALEYAEYGFTNYCPICENERKQKESEDLHGCYGVLCSDCLINSDKECHEFQQFMLAEKMSEDRPEALKTNGVY